MNNQEERAAFEAWAASYSTLPLDRDDSPAFGTTSYQDMGQAMLWEAWQARAALAAAPQAPLTDRERVLLDVERLRAEAERWRMTLLVNREVMIQPEKRKHQAAVDAYMAAVREGLNLEAAIEAAMAKEPTK